jgi:hypothetical protein
MSYLHVTESVCGPLELVPVSIRVWANRVAREEKNADRQIVLEDTVWSLKVRSTALFIELVKKEMPKDTIFLLPISIESGLFQPPRD